MTTLRTRWRDRVDLLRLGVGIARHGLGASRPAPREPLPGDAGRDGCHPEAAAAAPSLAIAAATVVAAPRRTGLSPTPPSYLVTPFTPDTAPDGLTRQRSRWVAPAMLVTFAVCAAAIEPAFPRLTYVYGREVARLAGDSSLRLPKQASIAIRPLFALLLVLFAVYGAGRWRDRLRLALVSVAVYAPVIVACDVVLARLERYGAPSPFMARGNLIIGVVGILTTALVVFHAARLPPDCDVTRQAGVRRRVWPLAALAAAVVASGVIVWLVETRLAGVVAQLKRVPLLGGAGSLVVIFFAVLPVILCLLGAAAVASGSGVRRVRRRSRPHHAASVCFVVPAHNEEGLIGDCVAALDDAACEYAGAVSLVVVENGSTDATPYEAIQAIADCHHLAGRMVTAPPLGKARALNVGVGVADAEVVCRIDADTLVAPDLLARMMPYFHDPNVGGVGVLPLPRNDSGWIGRMRAMETLYGVAFKRVAQSVCDAVTVLPGAAVAYRREVLITLDGFAEGVNGEDADITVRVGRLGYRIVSDQRIRVYTDVPHSLGQLREQRMRWARGLYHVVARNRSAIRRMQGVRGVWMLPWASFVMFRKLMLIPFACAAVGMVIVQPGTLPLREVAAAGAILLGVQLILMTLVLVWYRRVDLVCYAPAYLVFRLIVTYYAVETLLSLSLTPAARVGVEPGPAGSPTFAESGFGVAVTASQADPARAASDR